MTLEIKEYTAKELSRFSDYDNHRRVMHGWDTESGFEGFIAIHNINRGPALGGCRLWRYASQKDAITDVLRLSRGMTYKAAMADLPLGGGKAVIMRNAKTKMHREAQFRSLGRFIDIFNGEYIGGEDVGVDVSDALIIREETPFVAGIKDKVTADGTFRGPDPSLATAHGVRYAMLAAVQHRLGRDSLRDVSVTIQGCGHVGYHLARLLTEDGAALFVSDIDPDKVSRIVREFSASPCDPEEVYALPAYVYAPCALGATVNDQTIDLLHCEIVCGSANNQLQDASFGQKLKDRGILYTPDYAANGGGLIDVQYDRPGEVYDREDLVRRLERIGTTCAEIFERAQRERAPTSAVADTIAEERMYGRV